MRDTNFYVESFAKSRQHKASTAAPGAMSKPQFRMMSDDYLRLAKAAVPLDGARGGTSNAFQAGYIALLSALEPAELSRLDDHPNPGAARLGAERLGLAGGDCSFAEHVATCYYAPNLSALVPLSVCLDWARRVRRAAGWPD